MGWSPLLQRGNQPGSIPGSSIFTDMAQLGAQIPYKDKVAGSSPTVGTEVLGNGSPPDLGSGMCRFKSGRLNHIAVEWNGTTMRAS